MFLHVTVLMVVGLLLTAGLITLAWLLFGQRASANDRLDLVKVALVVVGGVGGVVALTIAYRKQRHGEVADRREHDKVFTDRYVKAAAPGRCAMTADSCAGAITRTELDDAVRELVGLVDRASEAGWDNDPTGEHRALAAARTVLAGVDQQLADRIDGLEQRHAHRAGFTTD